MNALSDTQHLLNDLWMIIVITIQVFIHILFMCKFWAVLRLKKNDNENHDMLFFLFSQCLFFPSFYAEVSGRINAEMICGFYFC